MSDEKDIGTKKSWRDRFARKTRERRPLSPRQRRWLVGGGIALAAVVFFILLPGFLASQPKFMQRYPRFSPEYQSWATSVHADVACQSCHVAPGLVPQTAYKARMVGEFYLSLVAPSRQPPLFKPPTNASCQSCHIELRTVSPSGDLNIPHRAHVTVLKMQCIQCHRYLVHQKNPSGTNHPTMATCLNCHNGAIAKNGCPTCHTNKDMPLNHRSADWLVLHPQMAAAPLATCKSCHGWTANWCAECHSHRPKSHGPDWRTTHGAAVKANRNCEACHQATFCTRCHGQLPMQNFSPALRLVQ